LVVAAAVLPTAQHTPTIKDITCLLQTQAAKVVVFPKKVLVLLVLHYCHYLHRMGMDTHHPSISILDLLQLVIIILLHHLMISTTSIARVVLLVVLLREKVTILVPLHHLLIPEVVELPMVHLLPA
jgi:hypothetical protein